jgi:hypothetical protein
MKTCDKCEHWTEGKLSCAQMGDSNVDDMESDKAYGWDHEGYQAGVNVGPKFGCIHWLKASPDKANKRRIQARIQALKVKMGEVR